MKRFSHARRLPYRAAFVVYVQYKLTLDKTIQFIKLYFQTKQNIATSKFIIMNLLLKRIDNHLLEAQMNESVIQTPTSIRKNLTRNVQI